MWKFLWPARPRQDGSNTNGNNKEPIYDPQCGMSKEEFEWRCNQSKMVHRRWPWVMHELEIHSKRMRQQFLDDPEALKRWNVYESDVRSAFACNLQRSLASPVRLPSTVLYRQLMKRKARSKTLVGLLSRGLNMLKQATKNERVVRSGRISAIFAAGAVAGLAVAPIQSQWKQQEASEG